MYEIELTTNAQRDYQQADKSLTRRVDRCFKILEQSPRSHPNIKQLKGEFASLFRFRIGDWRVVYRVDDARGFVTIVKIAHRSEVYE